MTEPLTTQPLDEITTRAAHIYEYVTVADADAQVAVDQLAGTDVPALLADNQHLRRQLEEMTRCRDNALRALHRDDVETDIDLAETIAAPFYGPGWDWDEPDLKRVTSVAADAVRPAFGKLTQQRDQALARVAELETAMEEIRHLHKDSPMGPCPVCIDADAVVAGGDGLMPYPCPTARLAGAEDCDPPSLRAAAEETHVVADDSNDPEHTEDCPGCETAAARPAATTQDNQP